MRLFGFLQKSPLELLYASYKKVLKEAHELSTTNRSFSDLKYVEAEKIYQKIEAIKNEKKLS